MEPKNSTTGASESESDVVATLSVDADDADVMCDALSTIADTYQQNAEEREEELKSGEAPSWVSEASVEREKGEANRARAMLSEIQSQRE